MITTEETASFIFDINKTYSIELTKADLFDIQNALSNQMNEVMSNQEIHFDERRAYFNRLTLIKAKIGNI